jgi:hypothetical protein
MAKDLVLGSTPRDWSAGISREESRLAYNDAVAYRDAPIQAKAVEVETQKNFQTALRLDAQKKLPAADRRAFGVTLRKWQALRDSRPNGFTGEDYVALTNLREENRRHTLRFTELESSPPDTSPPLPSRYVHKPSGSPTWLKPVIFASCAASMWKLYQMSK